MLFNTIDFIVFLIVVVVVYYAIPANKWRKLFLLASSYYFYSCWNVAFLTLLLFDTAVAYVASLLMNDKEKPYQKRVLWSSVVLILIPLFCFKYLNFFLTSMHDVVNALGFAMQVPEFELLLPIGISFYTFMSIYWRSAARPAPSPNVLVGVFTLTKIRSACLIAAGISVE